MILPPHTFTRERKKRKNKKRKKNEEGYFQE